MLEFMQLVQSRRSCRSFSSALPPRKQMEQLVQAALWAPSGKNQQLWHFTIVYNAEKSLALAQAVAQADNRGPEYDFYGAPVQIIISYRRDEHHAFVDGAAAMQNLLLMAAALGLGACWINQIRETCDDPSVRTLLTAYGVPKDHIVICSAAVGCTDRHPAAPPRREGTVTFTD